MELDELYQEIILDHYSKPRNYGACSEPTYRSHGENPACGDEIDLQVRVDHGKVASEVKFTGQGCAISQASASMMAQKMQGMTFEEIEKLMQAFHGMILSEGELSAETKTALGNLLAFQGVRNFPERVKCATLAWSAMRQIVSSLLKPPLD